jgi:hypothetical protein
MKNSYDLLQHCINCRSSMIVKNECGYLYSVTNQTHYNQLLMRLLLIWVNFGLI